MFWRRQEEERVQRLEGQVDALAHEAMNPQRGRERGEHEALDDLQRARHQLRRAREASLHADRLVTDHFEAYEAARKEVRRISERNGQ